MLSAGRPRVRKDAGLHHRARMTPAVPCGAIALEPRLLFDGAAAVVADAGVAGSPAGFVAASGDAGMAAGVSQNKKTSRFRRIAWSLCPAISLTRLYYLGHGP